jgi:3-phenylpropionate/trans-cinnamate dioxygenase ferredoxin reductase subunit
MAELNTVVIVGAGQAGAVTARSLRDMGYTGALTMVGDELHLPYERPPLSKEALGNNVHDSMGQMHDADFYADQKILHIGGKSVQKIDRERKEVVLDDGQRLGYDACVLATGGRARTIPLLPASLPQVHTLRTLDDAKRLSSVLEPDTRFVVIGGGFLGLEAAWTAKSKGAEVTVLEAGGALLSRVMPPFLSQWLLERAQSKGVDVRLNSALVSVDTTSPVSGRLGLVLDGAETIEADQVLVAVGLVPETQLAIECGLSLCDKTKGILVNEHCQTTDTAIWATGDCASQLRGKNKVMERRESWQNANVQSAEVAASMLSLPLPTTPYPWFWTDQFDCNIQILGAAEPGLQYVMRGELKPDDPNPKCIYLGLRDGVPVHGIAINAGGDLRTLRTLFEREVVVPTEMFTDMTIALKPFVKSCLQRVD